ncbi:MAG: hypothetical protein ACTTIX_07125 [Peptoanaerobacter stomatis]
MNILIFTIAFTLRFMLKMIIDTQVISKAKAKIKYVDTLKRKSYSKGYEAGLTYGRECVKR